MTFGERLVQRRVEVGLSQMELARLLETDQAHISRLEHGLIKDPGIVFVCRLARALHTSTDYLGGMYEFPAPPP